MVKKSDKNLYREKKKKEGCSSKSYVLHKDVIALIDKLNKETNRTKSEIVAEAIKAYAQSDYKKATADHASTVNDEEFELIKTMLSLLVRDYFINVHDWSNDIAKEAVSRLKGFDKPFSEMMQQPFFDEYAKAHPKDFKSLRLLKIFLLLNQKKFEKQ